MTTRGLLLANSRDVQIAQPRLPPVVLAWSIAQRTSCDVNIDAFIKYVISPPFLISTFSSAVTELGGDVSPMYLPRDVKYIPTVFSVHRLKVIGVTLGKVPTSPMLP